MFKLPTDIDWSLISKSITYYNKIGYKYIETPWRVSKQSLTSTFEPKNLSNKPFHLVGSAEQSFAELIKENLLESDNYVTCTPCFRKETEYDEIHFPYFMKVELIRIGSIDVQKCIDDAETFFMYTNKNVKVEKTNEGFDLTLNGIEIGSYGTREAFGFTWVYGTGLAEPRFSIANNKIP